MIIATSNSTDGACINPTGRRALLVLTSLLAVFLFLLGLCREYQRIIYMGAVSEVYQQRFDRVSVGLSEYDVNKIMQEKGLPFAGQGLPRHIDGGGVQVTGDDGQCRLEIEFGPESPRARIQWMQWKTAGTDCRILVGFISTVGRERMVVMKRKNGF
jgi:hypothetical protein